MIEYYMSVHTQGKKSPFDSAPKQKAPLSPRKDGALPYRVPRIEEKGGGFTAKFPASGWG
jgi:hypothetical protein